MASRDMLLMHVKLQLLLVAAVMRLFGYAAASAAEPRSRKRVAATPAGRQADRIRRVVHGLLLHRA